MLILTHRTDEKIAMPNLGNSMQDLRVQRNVVTVGIQAASDVATEHRRIDEESDQSLAGNTPELPAKGAESDIHDRLIDVRICAGLLRRQLGQGSLNEADETLETLMRQLLELDEAITSGEADFAEESAQSDSLMAANENESDLLIGV